MSDDAPRDRAVTEEAARTGEFPNATGDPTDDSNPVAGGGAADDDARVGGENEARDPDPPASYAIETGGSAGA